MPQPDFAVRVVDVVKEYGSRGATVSALRGVSVEVERGERVALLGKSGAGKSTLMNLLGGLDRPTSGRIEVGGKSLAEMDRDGLATHRRNTVGMVFQAYNLVASRTALQNVELPLIFAGRPPRERLDAARAAIEAVGLADRADHRPAELSGGEHQRIAIARALINDPEILLADEPTGNLDSATAGQILDLLLAHLAAKGTTLIMVTHDEELARRSVSRILRMKDGRIEG